MLYVIVSSQECAQNMFKCPRDHLKCLCMHVLTPSLLTYSRIHHYHHHALSDDLQGAVDAIVAVPVPVPLPDEVDIIVSTCLNLRTSPQLQASCIVLRPVLCQVCRVHAQPGRSGDAGHTPVCEKLQHDHTHWLTVSCRSSVLCRTLSRCWTARATR